MDDLLAFSNRNDIPVFTQAAIAHAQFESIHPFTDGNGRIGRALIGAILRRRGYTRSTTPPIASVLAADQRAYFAPDEWAAALPAREGSAPARLLGLLMDHPVISAEEAEDLTGASTSSVYSALDRLEAAGILHQITRRQRNRIWAVTAVLDELDDLDKRIGRRAQAGN